MGQPVHQVTKAKMVHQAQPAVALLTTVTPTLDTAKKPTFHLVPLATPSSGKATLSSTPLVTSELSPKISAPQALACDLSPPCHSSSVTSTNNATSLPETTTL